MFLVKIFNYTIIFRNNEKILEAGIKGNSRKRYIFAVGSIGNFRLVESIELCNFL